MSKPRKSRFSGLAPLTPKPATSTAGLPVTLQSGARRLSGKRANPAYRQLTAYVSTETHQAVKMALLGDGKGQEISELVDELLKDWLQKRR
jgi:hypothetical protein